jgi:hypothetical protein
MATRIPIPSVPIIDSVTGLVTKDWYDYFVSLSIANLKNFANDAAAAAGGVGIGGLYRNGSVVQIRVT